MRNVPLKSSDPFGLKSECLLVRREEKKESGGSEIDRREEGRKQRDKLSEVSPVWGQVSHKWSLTELFFSSNMWCFCVIYRGWDRS